VEVNQRPVGDRRGAKGRTVSFFLNRTDWRVPNPSSLLPWWGVSQTPTWLLGTEFHDRPRRGNSGCFRPGAGFARGSARGSALALSRRASPASPLRVSLKQALRGEALPAHTIGVVATIISGCIAQLVEHWAFNLMVAGSSPAIPKPFRIEAIIESLWQFVLVAFEGPEAGEANASPGGTPGKR